MSDVRSNLAPAPTTDGSPPPKPESEQPLNDIGFLIDCMTGLNTTRVIRMMIMLTRLPIVASVQTVNRKR